MGVMPRSSASPFPAAIEAHLAAANAALARLLAVELAHDRFSLSSHVWRAPIAGDIEDGRESWGGAFVVPLATPVRGRIELAFFGSALGVLETWLAAREVMEPATTATHGSAFTRSLVSPTQATPRDRPGPGLTRLAERLVDGWLSAFDGAIRRETRALEWASSVLETEDRAPEPVTIRSFSFDAKLAQLMAEPLGALFFVAPALPKVEENP